MVVVSSSFSFQRLIITKEEASKSQYGNWKKYHFLLYSTKINSTISSAITLKYNSKEKRSN